MHSKGYYSSGIFDPFPTTLCCFHSFRDICKRNSHTTPKLRYFQHQRPHGTGQERASPALTWQFMTGTIIIRAGLAGKFLRPMKEETEVINYQSSALQRPDNTSYCFCSGKMSTTELKTWMVIF